MLIKNKKYNPSKKRGSVLVFTLFIMMISLIIGIGIMSTASIGRKSTLASTKSVASFQVADSGIEYAFEIIRRYVKDNGPIPAGANTKIKDVFTNCDNSAGCTVTVSTAYGDYVLSFYDEPTSTTPMNCTAGGSLHGMHNVKKIKSVGTYNNITRSVEADVDMEPIFP